MLFASGEIPDQTRKTVISLCERGRLPQSVMLTGGSEALREKCASELAMAAVCSRGEKGQPCLKCSHCIKAKAGSHPDIITVTPEKDKKTVSRAAVKEQVMEKLYVAPNEAENKVFIFPNAHELSEVIQNMLLKSIEEPPEFVMFIFLCQQREGMLTTVISRCTEFPLGDTLSSKTKKEDEKVKNTVCSLVNAMCKGSEFDVMLASSSMFKNRALMKKTALKMITVIRDALAEHSGTPLLSGCDREAMALSMSFSAEQLLKIKASMDEIIIYAEGNANENLLLSKFSIALSHV